MPTFLSAALLIYGSMHLYAFGKVWMAFPHSFGLGLALTLAGIALKHQPVVDSTPFDLQLSGHIHGGQIFPFVYLTRLTYHVHSGLTALADGRRLYVSRGTGTWGPPIRLFAPPEIALISITSTNP